MSTGSSSPAVPEDPGRRFRRATRADAFALARDRFIAGERVEINELADELGVNRVTIYRWLGHRHSLLADVAWSLAEPTLHASYAHTRGRGPERLTGALGKYIRAILADHGFRQFLARESETALRVLTRAQNSFQPRLVAAVEELLAREQAAGDLASALPLDELAYLLVRVGESFVFTDTITGEPPDPDRAERAISHILQSPRP